MWAIGNHGVIDIGDGNDAGVDWNVCTAELFWVTRARVTFVVAGDDLNDAVVNNARIVSIADVYDAMVTDRPHASALTSYAAIKELNRLAGAFFNPALVSAFTQVVGLFPTGAIVHLSSGEVGIVTAQNPLRRLHPEVLLILNANKEPYEKHVSLNLAKQKPESAQVSIVEELTPGSYGVEAEHYFL